MPGKKKKASTPPVDGQAVETKNQKFVRLANQRVTAAVKRIHQIGNLGGQGYDSTEEQRNKIVEALMSAVDLTSSRLNKTTVKPSGFSL